jgi:two-component system, NtrC family, sensor histidine kinase KinB
MTLKQKVLSGYAVIAILLCIVVAWAVVKIVFLGKATDAILRQNYQSIIAAEKIVDALERQDSGMLIMFLGDTVKGEAMFQENGAEITKWLDAAWNSIYVPGEKELNESIVTYYEDYCKQFSAITSSIDQGMPISPSPIVFYEESIYPLFLRVRETCIKLRDLNETAMYNASIHARDVASRAIWSMTVVAALGLFAALILSLLLARRIVRPLQEFMAASRRISEGDYGVQVSVNTKDELGHLSVEFNKMSLQLKQFHEMDIEKIIIEKNKSEGIISSIDDGLVVFDPCLKVTGINPAARKILGLEVNDDAMLTVTDVIRIPHVCDLIRQSVETGTQPKDIPDEQRILIIHKDGRTYHYMFSITITKGREGDLSGIVLLLRDVTRLKEVERLKNDFVMAASHELRTPLTSMGMSLDLLKEHVAPKLPEREKDLIYTAHEETRRMKALVNDLLDLAKMEAGKINLVLASIPVGNLFNQIRDVFKNQIELKQVTLASAISDDLPRVMADENKIFWVLTNLVSNAMRYVPIGGHILLSADRLGPHAHVSVSDDGPGIPVEYQSKIFQKFVQVDMKQETAGSGLGLAICKEIVRAHRGTIWVESSPGQGSTFTFTLPVAQQ